MVVVRPEINLVAELSNYLSTVGIPDFGPRKEAVELEWKKEFARWKAFTNSAAFEAYINRCA